MPILFPRLIPIRQRFIESPPLDVRAATRSQLDSRLNEFQFKAGSRIAVAVGSRGIANLSEIVASVVEWLAERKLKPFIVPAMGSHGGATAEGQTALLAGLGVSEAALRAPVHASMQVEHLGRTEDGIDVYFSAEALAAEGIVVINRIKPHTDFAGRIGSGILKMIAIGLGKQVGASTVHAAAMSLGHEHVIRTVARRIFEKARVVAAVAILEGPRHETARIQVLDPDGIAAEEEALFAEAANLMPRLPFDEIDLLIVDRMGKNISGTGMDPNITGRGVHGYSSLFSDPPAGEDPGSHTKPRIKRIFVRELTPETHGNAIGIGLADFTTRRLVESIDRETTAINVLTALSLQTAKIPIYFETDREAIEQALASACLADTGAARVIRITDTLSLEMLEVSEIYAQDFNRKPGIVPLGPAREIQFDERGNLLPM